MNVPDAEPSTDVGAAPQRRERRSVSLKAHATLADGSVVDVTLLDLSYDGCGIQCPVALASGDAVRLSVSRLGIIGGYVRWYRDGKAGLTFNVVEEAATEAEKPQSPRRNERISVDAEASLRRAGQLPYRVRVYDISPEGCKAEFVERPQHGEAAWIKFDGLEGLEAQVCWVDGFCAGLTFTRPIHPAVFDLLVKRLRGGG